MQPAQRMNFIPFTPIRKVFEEAARREAAGETIIHLELGRPDFDTPAHIKDAAIRALAEGKVHYTSNYGIPELRNAIAAKFKTDNGLEYDPTDEIIVTVGATEGILRSMMAMLNPDDEVLIPAPSFPCYTRCAHMAGAVPVSVPLKEENGFAPQVADFRSRINAKTRMLVINTPNNPTGAVYDPQVMEALAELAVAEDLIVLADEIYEKNIYEGIPHCSIAVFPGMKDRTITLNGFSKSYSMTGWRLGYLASGREMIAALIRIRQYATVCPTSFAQYGAVAALEGSQECVAQMMTSFDSRRLMVIDRLQAMPGISFMKPRGAFYVFINTARLEKTPQEIVEALLDEAKIAVVPWGAQHIRISYANSYENLSKAMDALERVLVRWCGKKIED
jgi:aspartate/methionine/tyrosine aminotransferase